MFDKAIDLEEQHIEEGRQDGIRDGRNLGREEARALGLGKGFEIGHEIGYYSGCVQVWKQLQARNPDFMSARALKSIAALEEQLSQFPLDSPRDERIQELMDSIRGRFKAATAMLGLTEAYNQVQGQQGGGLQF